ncbi:MAG: hypothetical protein EOM24_38240, partial [Chloroflexia bacterium]|nr:hypothetical protein [Chloroflexia bacterium]
PISCCLHGLDRSAVRPGDTLVLVGFGAIGQIMFQLGELAGAARIIVVEPVAGKREKARALGAYLAVDPVGGDLAKTLHDHGVTHINSVIECVGRKETMELAIRLATPRATVMLFGLTPPGTKLEVLAFEDIFKKELTITGSYINPLVADRVIALMASERLDMSKKFATDIAYYYSKAGKPRLFEKWAAIAHQRHPTAITAFNLALTKRKQGDLKDFVRLMEEAISLDPDFASALEIYGHHLKERGNPKGIDCIEAAFKQFKEEFDHNTLAEDDLHRLRRAASTLGRQDVVSQVDLKCKDLSKREKAYDEGNLAASMRLPHALEKKEK